MFYAFYSENKQIDADIMLRHFDVGSISVPDNQAPATYNASVTLLLKVCLNIIAVINT